MPQGGSNSFNATLEQGPSGYPGCEILNPQGTVVFSVSNSSGGSANGCTVQVNYNGYYELPGFTVSAPPDAPLGAGYQVRTSAYYWSAGTAFFDVVPGNVTPTPTPTSPTPTPPSTYPTPTPTSPTPTPTSSGQLDALIRTQSGTFQGDGVYNFDGSNQSATQTAVAGNPASYIVQLQNESANSAQIRLSTSPVASGWTVRYFTGEGSSESKITSYFSYYGYWDSPSLAAGQSVDVRVTVEPPTTLSGGSALELLLSAASASDGQVRDAVKVTTSNSYSAPPPTPTPTVAPTPTTPPTPAVQPDAQIRLPGESDYQGDDIYNFDGAQQTELQFAAPGQSATFDIRIENDGTNAGSFTTKAPAVSNGWTFKLFDLGTLDAPQSAVEVTSAVTSENGWNTPAIASGGARLLRAELVRPLSGADDSDALLKVSNGSKVDTVRLVGTGQSVAGIEYSVDAGATWTLATGQVVSVSQWSVVGFRAIKGAANLPWPAVPFAPVWARGDEEDYGETIWLHFAQPTPDGLNGEKIQAFCGNTQSITVKVTPTAADGEGLLT